MWTNKLAVVDGVQVGVVEDLGENLDANNVASNVAQKLNSGVVELSTQGGRMMRVMNIGYVIVKYYHNNK